jgi:hypothetical protein
VVLTPLLVVLLMHTTHALVTKAFDRGSPG